MNFGFAVMITTPVFDISVAFCVSENLHHRLTRLFTKRRDIMGVNGMSLSKG